MGRSVKVGWPALWASRGLLERWVREWLDSLSGSSMVEGEHGVPFPAWALWVAAALGLAAKAEACEGDVQASVGFWGRGAAL